jgi:hypothetical protein
MQMASTEPNDFAEDEGNKNCTVTCETAFTRFVSKLAVYHT